MATIAELLLEKGRRMGQARRESGETSARMWQGIGQSIAGGVERYQQERAQEPVRRAQALQLEGLEAEAETRTQQTQAAQRRAQAFEAGTALLAQGVRDPKQLLEATGDPELATKLLEATLGLERLGIGQKIADLYKQHGENLTEAHIKALGPEAWSYVKAFQEMAPKPAGTREIKTVGPDGAETIQIVEDKPGQTFTSTPPKPKVTFGAGKKWVVDGKDVVAREGSDGNLYDMRGNVIEWTDLNIPEPKSGGQPQARTLTPNMESQVISRLANQWSTATAPARELDRQVSIMRQGLKAAESGDLAQGGQAVLVTFQKILDPSSVVRESEFDRSREGLSLKQRAEAAVERLVKGGAGVPLGELKKYAALAEQIASAQRDSRLKAIQERLGKTADRYQIPRELVFESGAGGEQPIGEKFYNMQGQEVDANGKVIGGGG